MESEGPEAGGPRVMAVGRMIVCAGPAAVEPTWATNHPINETSAPMIGIMNALAVILCAARDSNPGPAD